MKPKWMAWEFWPYPVFYTPLYFHILFLAIRYRSLGVFLAVNPALFLGGFVEYSKWEVYKNLPQSKIPLTRLLPQAPTKREWQGILKEMELTYPLILKPDVGERGFGVKVIKSEEEAFRYFQDFSQNILVQEYIHAPEEWGVLVEKDPRTGKVQITSLSHKEIPFVLGDGSTELKTLMKAHPRYRVHQKRMEEYLQGELKRIPPREERVYLTEPVGNHCRGATFLSKQEFISPKMEEVFSRILSQFPGLYFGRFDVKCDSWKSLEQGDFSIIELNGAASEPAHIYDPQGKLLEAYRFLFRQWSTIARIGHYNRIKGAAVPGIKTIFKHILKHNKRIKEGPHD